MKRLFLLFALGALFAGCAKYEQTPNNGNVAINFTAGINVQTKASGNTWESGDAAGIFMIAKGQPLLLENIADGANNIKYNVTAGTNGSFSPALTAEKICFPHNGSNVDFIAYYPYKATGIGAGQINNFVYPVDLTDQSNPAKIDLLYSNNAKTQNKSNPNVGLVFDHMMSKIVLNIKAGKGMTDSEVAGVSVEIKNMLLSAGFSLSAKSFSPKTSGNITPIKLSSTPVGYAAVFEAIVIPEDGKTSRVMAFTVNGITYKYNIPDGTLFLSGRSHPYNVTVDKTGVSIESGQVTDWTNGGSTSGKAYESVLISAGEFMMGSPANEPGRIAANETRRKVTLTNDFYMSKYEITNAQFCEFLNAKGVPDNGIYNTIADGEQKLVEKYYTYGVYPDGTKWTTQSGNENLPVMYVTWYGADEFCRWAGGSLPTEAQWEYACRAGNNTPFGLGNGKQMGGNLANINGIKTYDYDIGIADGTDGTVILASGKYLKIPTAVGRYSPNAWGLYDMHGNVSEWCKDKCDSPVADYGSAEAINPEHTSGSYRIMRGGYFGSPAIDCRSAIRSAKDPLTEEEFAGFRIVFNVN